MKMKKITAMALACVMALGLAACGGTSSSTGTSADSAAPASSTGTAAEPCDLVVAWWGSQGRNEKFQSALDLYAEQNPGVTIESQTNGFSDHLTALSAAAASNDMPDMAMLQGAYYQQYVDGDLLVDLMPYVESGALDLSNVSESVLAATTIDGKLYGVCAGTNSPSVIYNKTLLDEAGITIEDNMNLDQFAEKCAEIYEKTGYRSFISNPSQMIEMLVRGEGKILYETDKLGVESAEELQPYFALLERGREEGWLMNEIIMAEPGVPASSEAAKAIEPNLSDIQKKIFTYINDVITPNCSPANPPAGAGSSEVTSLITDLEEKVYYGEITAEAAAQELFEEGNRIMSEAAAQ